VGGVNFHIQIVENLGEFVKRERFEKNYAKQNHDNYQNDERHKF